MFFMLPVTINMPPSDNCEELFIFKKLITNRCMNDNKNG
jgi:hypothetical protein